MKSPGRHRLTPRTLPQFRASYIVRTHHPEQRFLQAWRRPSPAGDQISRTRLLLSLPTVEQQWFSSNGYLPAPKEIA